MSFILQPWHLFIMILVGWVIRTARNIGPLMPVVETLNTQLRDWGLSVADPAKELSHAHEHYLLYNEHTWGGAASVTSYGEAFEEITLAKKFLKATPVNLRGEKIDTPLAITGGEISIDLRAYAPASFLIQ